ncbi:hypothetical protein MIR68_000154 [Amoeboaphelidium protococcarum]|nr:hypothetical protein MIR68_000154 [Amoeboaphelidium protococcarum]
MARPEANAGLNVPGCPIPVQEILSNGFFKTYFEAIGEAYHALVLRSVYLAALAAKRQGGDFLEVARNTLRLKMVMLGQINQDYRPEMSNALRRELIEGSISEERRAETERFKIQQ